MKVIYKLISEADIKVFGTTLGKKENCTVVLKGQLHGNVCSVWFKEVRSLYCEGGRHC